MKRSSPVALLGVLLLGVSPLVVSPDLSLALTWTFQFGGGLGPTPLWEVPGLSASARVAWLAPLASYLLALASATSGVVTGRESPRLTAWLLAISLLFPTWVYTVNTQVLPVGVLATGAVIAGFYWPGVFGGREAESRSSVPADRGDAGDDAGSDGDDEPAVDEADSPDLADSPAPEDVDEPANPGAITPRAAADAVKKVGEEGSFREAELSYEAMLVDIRAAVDEFGDRGEPERRASAERRLRQAVARRDAVRALRRERAEFRETLVAAEESYRTAVVAHVDGRSTLSKLRYRQARDAFDDALAALEETDGLLAAPLEVEATPDGQLRSTSLTDLLRLSETAAEALADAGIETVDDAREAAPDDGGALSGTEPVAGLLDPGAMDDETAARLDALAAYGGDAPLTVAGQRALERRRDRAAAGYEAIL